MKEKSVIDFSLTATQANLPMNNSNLNSNGDSDSLQNQAMSDARLDELLDLAQPTLDPKRQKTIHRQVEETLESSRSHTPEEPWANWISSGLLDLLVSSRRSRSARLRLAIAVCGSMLLVWTGWSMLPTANSVDHVAKNTTNNDYRITDTVKANEPKVYPPIIFQTPATTAPRIAAVVSQRRPIFKPDAEVLRTTLQRVETTLLKTAGSKIGLSFVERWSSHMEQSAVDLQTSLAAQSGSRYHRRQSKEIQNRLRQIEATRRRLDAYLTDCLTRLPKDQATDAFRILCRVGSQRSLPVILEHWNYPPTKPDAVVAVKRLGDSRLIVRLISDSSETETQTQLMASLLCQSDPSSVDLFLHLTAKQELYSVAQRCGAILGPDCSPIEMLVERLGSNRMAIARAAAITMAEMNDPRISEHLMQLALQPESARPAVMALTARTDLSAVRFIELAATDARWSATVINEKKKWNRLLANNQLASN